MMHLITSMPNDTDSNIVKKQMQRELELWIAHLDDINSEAERLAKIASNRIGDKLLRDDMLNTVDDTILLLNHFYTYRNSLNNFDECDDLECDMHFVQQHENICEKYTQHLKAYRALKDRIYLQLL